MPDAFVPLKEDLPGVMIIAAFAGISWYISVELNIRLFFTFRRRRGLYFWSCLLSSWGVFIQPLVAILTNFGVWDDKVSSRIVIYLSWFIMVIPQSYVLYSRLHVVTTNWRHLRWLLYTISAVSVIFSIPTITMGILAQTVLSRTLADTYLIWDKLQLTVFFVQETVLSLLYIIATRQRLNIAAGFPGNTAKNNRRVHLHLIHVNILVILLDISLLVLSFADYFYIQSAYKPCVYGIKLRIEFAILNQLIDTVRRPSQSNSSVGTNWMKSKRSTNADAVRLGSIDGQSEASGVHIAPKDNPQTHPSNVFVQKVIPDSSP